MRCSSKALWKKRNIMPMRRLEAHPSEDMNSLVKWHIIKNPLRVTFNFTIIYLCRVIPSLWLKRKLLRLTGMKLKKKVSIGLFAMFDIFFPELIEIGEGSIIGYNTTILAHEFLVEEGYDKGKFNSFTWGRDW
ncbi:hypothetical protein BMS3Bbin15_01051 [archaeon BMS3Bbin15]|nr:hypothetical protein BMS3Bbin15_01051 [archaeon BMS3Bbin15]